jgi:hypothetical protein
MPSRPRWYATFSTTTRPSSTSTGPTSSIRTSSNASSKRCQCARISSCPRKTPASNPRDRDQSTTASAAQFSKIPSRSRRLYASVPRRTDLDVLLGHRPLSIPRIQEPGPPRIRRAHSRATRDAPSPFSAYHAPGRCKPGREAGHRRVFCGRSPSTGRDRGAWLHRAEPVVRQGHHLLQVRPALASARQPSRIGPASSLRLGPRGRRLSGRTSVPPPAFSRGAAPTEPKFKTTNRIATTSTTPTTVATIIPVLVPTSERGSRPLRSRRADRAPPCNRCRSGDRAQPPRRPRVPRRRPPSAHPRPGPC